MPQQDSKTAKRKFLPYGRQTVTTHDIASVKEVLESDWLTQGPMIDRFEADLAEKVGSKYSVACSNGTAALHLAMLSLGVGRGDTVVTTPNTFLADANCARYVGANVAFADIDANTGNISSEALANLLAKDHDKRIKVVIPVHFAGQPCDIADISYLARKHGAFVVEDACHAIGASYEHEGSVITVGSCYHSDLTVFSFHPVKHVAMGEGGAITTNSYHLNEKLRLFRSHGMNKLDCELADMAISPEGIPNPWYYEMRYLGYNYRLSDIQAGLGVSQLSRLDESIAKRNQLANVYDTLISKAFPDGTVKPLKREAGRLNAYHLYVIAIDFEGCGISRAVVMNSLRDAGIGSQVHYVPVPLQPYYRKHTRAKEGDFPEAESYYATALSIPMYPALEPQDCEYVIATLKNILR